MIHDMVKFRTFRLYAGALSVNVCAAAKELVVGTTASGFDGVLLSFALPERTIRDPFDATGKGSEKSNVPAEPPAFATLM